MIRQVRETQVGSMWTQEKEGQTDTGAIRLDTCHVKKLHDPASERHMDRVDHL